MKTVELKAEALYQTRLAMNSGIRKFWTNTDAGTVIEYNNGTITADNGNNVTFELNGEIYNVTLLEPTTMNEQLKECLDDFSDIEAMIDNRKFDDIDDDYDDSSDDQRKVWLESLADDEPYNWFDE